MAGRAASVVAQEGWFKAADARANAFTASTTRGQNSATARVPPADTASGASAMGSGAGLGEESPMPCGGTYADPVYRGGKHTQVKALRNEQVEKWG